MINPISCNIPLVALERKTRGNVTRGGNVTRNRTDINNLIGLSMREKDQYKRKLERQKLSEETLPKWLGYLETILQKNTLSEWFAGEKMSIADLAIWRLLGWIISGKLEHVPITLLNTFPNLTKLYKNIDSYPKVQEWMLLKYPRKNTP